MMHETTINETWIVLNILAILLSPLFAWYISQKYFEKKQRKDQKMWIFSTLMSLRHDLMNENHLRALNSIDIFFNDNEEIYQTWHEFIELMNTKALKNDEWFKMVQKKHNRLTYKMAINVGLKNISERQFDEFYAPNWIVQNKLLANDISTELLRVLKNTERFCLETKKLEIDSNTSKNHKDPSSQVE